MIKKNMTMLAVMAALSVAGPAQAAKYNASNWLPISHELAIHPYEELIPAVKEKTEGRIEFVHFTSGSLIPARTTMQGVRDGVAAVGVVFPGYSPSEFPLSNVVNDLAFTSSDEIASALAWSEINFTNEDLQNEWKKNGGVFGGGYTTPTYELVCNKPVNSLESAGGLKYRSSLGVHTEWIQAMNGVAVSVPIGDVYSGIQRGSIDCALADLGNLDSMKLHEVATHVTILKMGGVNGASWVYNRNFWKKASPEDKRILMDEMAYGMARTQIGWATNAQNALESAQKKGMKVIEAPAELQEKFDGFNQAFIEKLPQASQERRKIADPSGLVQDYIDSYTKWVGLLQNVDRSDSQALGALIKAELYDKVELDTYGLK